MSKSFLGRGSIVLAAASLLAVTNLAGLSAAAAETQDEAPAIVVVNSENAEEYKVSFPMYTCGYNISYESLSSPVDENAVIRFKVNILDGYKADELLVTFNGEPIYPDGEGYYSISGINRNSNISVEGVVPAVMANIHESIPILGTDQELVAVGASSEVGNPNYKYFTPRTPDGEVVSTDNYILFAQYYTRDEEGNNTTVGIKSVDKDHNNQYCVDITMGDAVKLWAIDVNSSAKTGCDTYIPMESIQQENGYKLILVDSPHANISSFRIVPLQGYSTAQARVLANNVPVSPDKSGVYSIPVYDDNIFVQVENVVPEEEALPQKPYEVSLGTIFTVQDVRNVIEAVKYENNLYITSDEIYWLSNTIWNKMSSVESLETATLNPYNTIIRDISAMVNGYIFERDIEGFNPAFEDDYVFNAEERDEYTVSVVENPMAEVVGIQATLPRGETREFFIRGAEGCSVDNIIVTVNGKVIAANEYGMYTIENVSSDIEIEIFNVEWETREVTPEVCEGVGLTLYTPETVQYGSDVEFDVEVLKGYDASNMIVRANDTILYPVAVTENGVYKYKLSSITSDTKITVEGVTAIKTPDSGETPDGGNGSGQGENPGGTIDPDGAEESQRFTISASLPAGVTLIAKDGKNTVEKGGSYTFSLRIAEGYDASNISININGEVVSLGSDGTYTIENITENQKITVSNVQKKKYNVSIRVLDGITLSATTNSYEVQHGNAFTFKIAFDSTIDPMTIDVRANGKSLTGSNWQYTISDITEDTNITITANGKTLDASNSKVYGTETPNGSGSGSGAKSTQTMSSEGQKIDASVKTGDRNTTALFALAMSMAALGVAAFTLSKVKVKAKK